MKKACMSILLTLLLTGAIVVAVPVSTHGPSSVSPDNKTSENSPHKIGAINDPLVILWSQPRKQYERISLQAAADPAGWARGLPLEMRQWLVDKADTMALFGERVVILDRREDWLKVAAVSQRTTLNPLGYPGWVLAKQVTINPVYLEAQITKPQIIVAVPRTRLFKDMDLAIPHSELSWQVALPLVAETSEVVEVRLPDGTTGFLPKTETYKSTELSGSSAAIVNQARQFLGQKYLWAGTSAYGFDCSGLTLRIYQSQGLSIPRDAHEQARAGVPVDKADLLPGDLLFFASNDAQGEIHHVAIYSGNGMMIHAPNNRSEIKEESIHTDRYAPEYWGARRYAPMP